MSDLRPQSSTSALQREIRQTRPFRSRRQEAVLALYRTSDMVRRVFDGVIEPSGATQQQYNVLRILRGAGSDGLPTLSIAERMVERAPGITRLIDRLVAKGWVDRSRDAADRRRVHCRITPAGLDLLASLDDAVDRADGDALGMLPDEMLEGLIAILDRIRAGLGKG